MHKQTITKRANRAIDLKTQIDAMTKELKEIKCELLEVLREDCIKTDRGTIKLSSRAQFESYRLENDIYDMIPNNLFLSCVSLDRAKINDLIRVGILPEKIREYEMIKNIDVITIKSK